MGVTPTPLTLQFANQTVSITFPAHSEDCIAQHLHRHFAGCLAAEQAAATAVFRLTMPQNRRWQLWQNDTLILEADSIFYLFEPLMQAVLAQLITFASDHLILHAGGVALADDGVLLCGASGSGKSTLTARLLQNGFRYLSDEAMAVDLDLGVGHGFARSLVLKAGSGFVWREQRASQEVLVLPHGAAWVTPVYLHSDVCPYAPPKLILFPQFEAGRALSVQPLAAGEVAFRLLQNLANARNLPEQGFRLAAELARQAPAYRVTYGEETAVAAWLRGRLNGQ